MSILCGTDFSATASTALTAAAKLGVRMGQPLHLAHALEFRRSELQRDGGQEMIEWAERHLDRRAQQLRDLGAEVHTHLEFGPPDEVLLALAAKCQAELIVIGPLGHRDSGRYRLGGHADRLAQRTQIPVLVVRDAEPFRAWVDQERPLQILLGADLSRTSDAALSFVERLRRFGPCAVTAVHLYWPPEQFRRLGLSGARSYLDPDPEVTSALARELQKRFASLGVSGSIECVTEPHLGRAGDRLADLAAQHESHLLVVGSRDRGALERLWTGSVSRAALHASQTSVACVPALVQATQPAVPRVRTVMVATDRSPAANAAIPLAYSLAQPDGIVHLVEVTTPPERSALEPHDVLRPERLDSAPAEAALAELRSALPTKANLDNTRYHRVESSDPAAAICQVAERLDADLICLGTHGRSGVSKALLGSVAQAVAVRCTRPVVLVHEPRD